MTTQAQATGTPDAREQELLRRRAERLAARAPGAAAEPDAVQALEFSIGDELCVVELDWVREVRALGELLPVPLAPEPLLGLVPLRGRMLSVLDVRVLLGTSGAAPAPRRLLVLGRDGAVFGVAAAEVHGLCRVSPQLAQRRGAPLETVRPDLVRGVTREGHLFLDGERLLGLARGATP